MLMGLMWPAHLPIPKDFAGMSALLDAYPEGETVAWSTFHALRGRALLNFLEDGETARAGIAFRRASELGDELGMHFWRLHER